MPSATEPIQISPGVEFVPVAKLGDGSDAISVDYARSRGRWQALPEGWMSAKDMREALMRIGRVPEYDGAAGEALLAAMEDFLEVRGSGRACEYRRREVLPEPMSVVEVLEADTTRRADLEHERFNRELKAREAVHAERDRVHLDGNRRLHRELADEYTTPRVEALERRLAQLEEQPAQHGELEAADTTNTPTPSDPAAETIRARARRFMFGDMEPAEIDLLLEQEQDDEDDKEISETA